MSQPFFKKENFWNAVVLTVAAIYAAGGATFPTAEAQNFVSLVFAMIIGGNFLFNYFKDTDIRVKAIDVLKSTNVQLNILAVLAILLPNIFNAQLNAALLELFVSLSAGRLEAILVAGFGFVRVVYNMVKKPAPLPEATRA